MLLRSHVYVRICLCVCERAGNSSKSNNHLIFICAASPVSILINLVPLGNSFKRNASMLCAVCVVSLCAWPFSIWSRCSISLECERDKQLSSRYFHWLSTGLWILGIFVSDWGAIAKTTWRVFNFLCSVEATVYGCVCIAFPRAELCSIFQFTPHQIIMLHSAASVNEFNSPTLILLARCSQ